MIAIYSAFTWQMNVKEQNSPNNDILRQRHIGSWVITAHPQRVIVVTQRKSMHTDNKNSRQFNMDRLDSNDYSGHFCGNLYSQE